MESLLGETGHLDLDETAGPTGSWDARTDAAARSFQRDQGLAIDGLLAPAGPTIGRLGDTLGGKVVAKPVKAPSPTRGNPLDGANPLGVMPGAGANPLAEAAPEPKPWLQPAPKPPSPLPARADTAGVVVPDEAIAANRRLVDHLKTTGEDGPLPTYLADEAGRYAEGHVEVDDFFAQLHEHLPERARTLGAKVRTLMDEANPPKPAKPAGIVETRPAKPGETWDPVRGKSVPGAPPRAETETAPEPETLPNYRWDSKAGRWRPVRPHGPNPKDLQTHELRPGQTRDPETGKWRPDTPEEAAGKRGVNKPYYPNHIWDPVARQWRPKTPEEAGESDMQPMAEPGPGGGAGPGAGPGATGGASPGPSGPGPGPDGKLPPGVPSDDEAPGDGAPLPGYTPGGVKPGAGGKPGSGGSKSWRYYAGPHLSKAAEDLGTAAKALLEYASPGADIKDAADASRRAEEAFRGGDYAKAATEFGNAGLSALGVLIPGTTKGYRKAGEKAGEALSDALSARRAAPRAANNPPKPDVPLTKRNEEAFKDRYDDWWKSQGHTLDAARKADPNRRVAPGESFIWQNLERGKDGRTRTNGVSGKNALHFSFDHGGGGRHHSEIEVFDSRGRHLGTIDPLSGEWIGDAVKGRKMDMSSLHDGNNTRYV